MGSIKIVSAGGLQSAYERVWIFYAYQIDMWNLPERRTIAPWCQGSRMGGACTFTELMEVIDGQTPGAYAANPDPYLPDDPTDWYLDPDTTARHMFNKGYIGDLHGDNFMVSGSDSYIQMLKDVAKVIGDAKNTWPPDRRQMYQGLFDLGLEQSAKLELPAF